MRRFLLLTACFEGAMHMAAQIPATQQAGGNDEWPLVEIGGPSAQIGYIVGYTEGLSVGAGGSAGSGARKDGDAVAFAVLSSWYPKNALFGECQEGLDKFYAVAANRPIPVYDAIFLRKMRASGAPEIAVDQTRPRNAEGRHGYGRPDRAMRSTHQFQPWLMREIHGMEIPIQRNFFETFRSPIAPLIGGTPHVQEHRGLLRRHGQRL